MERRSISPAANPQRTTLQPTEYHREKALQMIFTHFCKKNGLSHLKKATFDEMKRSSRALDLAEFLLFCKHFEVPLSSKSQLKVFRKIVDKSDTGQFFKNDFKEALELLFLEVYKQKLAGLGNILMKRVK